MRSSAGPPCVSSVPGSQVPLRLSEHTQSPQLGHPVRTRQGAGTRPSADLWTSPTFCLLPFYYGQVSSVDFSLPDFSVSRVLISEWEHCYKNQEPLLRQDPHTHPSITDDLPERRKKILTLHSCLSYTPGGLIPVSSTDTGNRVCCFQVCGI